MQGILDERRVSDFKRDGFVVLPGVFDTVRMREIADWADDVHALPEIPGAYMMYFEQSALNPAERILCRIEDFARFHDGFESLFEGPELQGGVAQLLGEPAVLFKEKINFKLPAGDGFKPHQDQQAGWSTYTDFFITALVCIDEATVENGCLELAAGYHDKGLVGDEWVPLADDTMADMKFVPYPMKPGDVAFFDSYAPHGSAPNLTDAPRCVLYVTYNRASAGDHRIRYYADKRESYPPDIDREPDKEYRFRV
ncbi:MAG: phytanoyl-CoA dioxygenase family protein [Alphaproteobacteria bacterium]